MSVTDEIKSRLDIVNYIQQVVPLKKAGRNYKACCPFHSERTPSFVVNPDSQTWRCFGACSEGGDIFNFAMKHYGWDFPEALHALGELAGVEVQKRTPEQRERDDRLDKLRGLMTTAAEIYHKHLLNGDTPEAKQARAYIFHKRGLTEDTVRKFEIGFAPPGWQNMLEALTDLGYAEDDIIDTGMVIKNDNGRVYDRFRNRIMIPIHDTRGRVVAFGGRVLDPEDNPKYLNSPQTPVFDKSRTLFGFHLGKETIRKDEVAVIVEGYMDVIQAHQAGFSNVVAQMGTAMTESQLKTLAPRYAKKIVLALDADAAGQNATRRSLETARETLAADFTGKLSVDMRILQIPGAKDPDDLLRESPDVWQTLVDDALPIADYVINTEAAGLGTTPTVQEREAAARRVLPLLTVSENNLYTRDNLQKLALKLRIPERDLLNWAQEQPQAKPPTPSRSAPAPTDEPPARDYDVIVPPDEDDEALYDDDIGLDMDVLALPELPVDASLETYCIRALLAIPELLYLTNRKLRELGADNPALVQGPLMDFAGHDFSRADYRTLIDTFIVAVQQHDMDVHEYMEAELKPEMLRQYQRLHVADMDHMRQRVGGHRFEGDFTSLWRKFSRQAAGGMPQEVEFLIKVLQLRVQRLNRELDDLSFAQQDSQAAGDIMAALDFGAQIMLSTKAKTLLEAEINVLSARMI